MRIRIIEKQTLPRWHIALSESMAEATRAQYADLRLGKVVDVNNDFALWLIARGYCEQVREEPTDDVCDAESPRVADRD